MAYPAISLSAATAGRHRCPQERLQTARQPPVYPNSSPDHRACNSLTPFPCPRAVHRWIRVKLPGVARIGHGVHAISSPRLIDKVLEADVILECCLTSNVVLGAASSLKDHPIGKLMEAGIPVTLASDDPVRLCTGIGREYELAMSLGFGSDQLVEMSTSGIQASFARPSRKESLLRQLGAISLGACHCTMHDRDIVVH